ncbi:hypothetical protein FNU76_05170 [Chitinimonas arctica]|uniref:Uncharacterized protein n=1 Tax=Chitinimonas arctica TaxID=2594795 RepID=A0A516SCA9_9NEIS|nr:hypothetical protein [Chitinimonas arctica]QDQ25789.1 hypothetical protein FNU76_05170 [Chitinimonas arctica]
MLVKVPMLLDKALGGVCPSLPGEGCVDGTLLDAWLLLLEACIGVIGGETDGVERLLGIVKDVGVLGRFGPSIDGMPPLMGGVTLELDAACFAPLFGAEPLKPGGVPSTGGFLPPPPPPPPLEEVLVVDPLEDEAGRRLIFIPSRAICMAKRSMPLPTQTICQPGY